MGAIANSPFVWLKFDEKGVVDAAGLDELSRVLNSGGVDELVVMSHGWKNDERDAEKLYRTLWTHCCAFLAPERPARITVGGVLWSSKAYPDNFDSEMLAAVSQAGALGRRDAAAVRDLDDADFDRILAEFENFIGPGSRAAIAAARVAASGLTANEAHDLVTFGARAVAADACQSDVELAKDAAPVARSAADAAKAKTLLLALTAPPRLQIGAGVVKAQGLGDIVQSLFSGPKAAIARFLNQLTYYEMKKRAGVVGNGLAESALQSLAPARPIRLHLVGHSFGARLVTAAADRLAAPGALDFFSLTLLQGAYSHNGLAQNLGAFPSVVGKPTGPIVITHTHNDIACTLAYAIASRLSRDTAQGIGDRRDEFGAMGANGPQRLEPTVLAPEDETGAFRPERGKVNPILADRFIVKTESVDAHNNVDNKECGRLLAATLSC
ncbi:hypothetical protein [Methylosinus sp. KRF6]|uniref:hypothetical protein n=1 Tax=Methylosinus sp. KRF6 TaxID=2846853 RepID=UPI001C0DF57B|nr:hypothetical protein [Methylosinus sp. KRF6]MBU3889307.1 hypothetical protein [Methylosinus sp. KRF6]